MPVMGASESYLTMQLWGERGRPHAVALHVPGEQLLAAAGYGTGVETEQISDSARPAYNVRRAAQACSSHSVHPRVSSNQRPAKLGHSDGTSRPHRK